MVMLTTMNGELNLAKKVRALKPGKSFIVSSSKERQAACRVAKSLKDAGIIEFDVVTRAHYDGTYKVAAI